MIKLVAIYIFFFAVSACRADVLDGCPSNNFQAAGPENITIHDDGTLTVTTSADDDMQGRWGGQLRAEINSKHAAYSGEVFEYRYNIIIDDVPMDWPVVIFQLKQSGHSPTVALEWRNNRVYIKHRYNKNGTEHGPTMAPRQIVPGEPMNWKIRVKPSHGGDGFIEVYDGDKLADRYSGPTLLLDSDYIHLKYGIYSFRLVDGITSRKIRILDCQVIKLD